MRRTRSLALTAVLAAMIAAAGCGPSGGQHASNQGAATPSIAGSVSCSTSNGAGQISITAGKTPILLSNVGVEFYDSDGQPVGGTSQLDSDRNAMTLRMPGETVSISTGNIGYWASTARACPQVRSPGLVSDPKGHVPISIPTRRWPSGRV
jgi:hypothetical protein